MNIFSEQKAFELASFSSFQKGQEYYEDGLVKKLYVEGTAYKAKVQGTGLYTVTYQIKDDRLETTCSCPYNFEGICKHAVAAILAFAASTEFEEVMSKPQKEDSSEEIKKIVKRASEGQIRTFLQHQLKKSPTLVIDFQIFLQGTQPTSIPTSDYKTQFRNELDQLDLQDLLNACYYGEENYYEDQYEDIMIASLEDVVDGFIDSAEKYKENKNYAEALKIYQSIFEAIDEKRQTLKGEFLELSDIFIQEMDKTVDYYIKALGKIDNKNLKKVGIKFLCSIFKQKSHGIDRESIVIGFKQIITNKNEANYCLECLKLKEKINVSAEESMLLAFLYFLIENWKAFENISLKNLTKYPNLALDLLKYYQKNNDKNNIIQVSDQVLITLTNIDKDNELEYTDSYLDNKDIEIQIRCFLKNIYLGKDDYPRMIANLEQLFLVSGKLTDYKDLVKNYNNAVEKEAFWSVIKKHFNNMYEVKIAFKVFKFEDKKQEVLKLIKKYPQAECFPEMVAFVRDSFPGACFTVYQKKIEEILIETNVDIYPIAVYHLKRMKEIGLDREFIDFVSWIKTTYRRRRRFMEELYKNKMLRIR